VSSGVHPFRSYLLPRLAFQAGDSYLKRRASSRYSDEMRDRIALQAGRHTKGGHAFVRAVQSALDEQLMGSGLLGHGLHTSCQTKTRTRTGRARLASKAGVVRVIDEPW
jgi:hypothetical protein